MKSPLHLIDEFLNSITMYRLVLYGLLILSGLGIAFSFMGILPYNGIQLLISFLLIGGICGTANIAFSKIFKAPTNIESPYITALILFLILLPPSKNLELAFIIIAAFVAIASKYIMAIKKKHIFNPVAIALLLIGFAGSYSSAWWVASAPLFPFILIIGLLVVRKIRRFTMFFTFFATSFTTIMLFGVNAGVDLLELTRQIFASWPILFFGTIMLTEPLTLPPNKKTRNIYGFIAGVIISLQFQVGPIHPTPELALVIANIYSFIVSPKQKFILAFKDKKSIAENVYEFVFKPDQTPQFTPGQYMEWTLPHEKSDDRGNRRYFTIASSPTEQEIKLGIKISTNGSSYKSSLLQLDSSSKLAANQLAGDFVLPKDKMIKLVFIAGGIGITPFRSMIKYLTDKAETRDVVLFYASSSPKEFAYTDIFEQGKKAGLKTHYIITHSESTPPDWKGLKGHIDEAMIKTYIKDYQDRMFYLSGPNSMVNAYKKLLENLGVKHRQIITDYFPGF